MAETYLGLNEGNNTTLRDDNITKEFVQPDREWLEAVRPRSIGWTYSSSFRMASCK